MPFPTAEHRAIANHQYKHCDTRLYVHLRAVGPNDAATPDLLRAVGAGQ